MFHHTNFGQFGETLKRFADLDGYVPQDGDDLERFRYPSGWFDSEWLRAGGDDPESDEAAELISEAWEDHVAEAVQATERAAQALSEWQAQALSEWQAQNA